MDYLLDTHTFLWFAGDPGKLPQPVREIIENADNSISVSIASFWEIAIKDSIGKLPLSSNISALAKKAEGEDISIEPLTIQAIEKIALLPHHHKDPFDRIIAATALTTGDVLLSADPVFDAYRVARKWQSRG